MEDHSRDFQDNLPHRSFSKFLIDSLGANCFYSGVFIQPVMDEITSSIAVDPTTTLSPTAMSRQVRRKSHILQDEKYLEGLLIRWAFLDDPEK